MTKKDLGKKLRRIIESNKEGTNDPTGAHSISYRLAGLITFAHPEANERCQRAALERWGKGELETIEELHEGIKQLILELRDELPWSCWKRYFWNIWVTYLSEDAPLADKW